MLEIGVCHHLLVYCRNGTLNQRETASVSQSIVLSQFEPRCDYAARSLPRFVTDLPALDALSRSLAPFIFPKRDLNPSYRLVQSSLGLQPARHVFDRCSEWPHVRRILLSDKLLSSWLPFPSHHLRSHLPLFNTTPTSLCCVRSCLPPRLLDLDAEGSLAPNLLPGASMHRAFGIAGSNCLP